MKYPHGNERVAGVLIPLAALRSDHSVGCGEFADLPGLAEWCKAAGLKLIQLLPVNDTGNESSPYSALSAYALHPLYLRIDDLPELESISAETRHSLEVSLKKMRSDFEDAARFDYTGVLLGKINLLRVVYEESRETILKDRRLSSFIGKNPWVRPYSVFRALKDRNKQRAWSQWDEHRDVDAETVERLWKSSALKENARFYAWLQMRLAEQFLAASEAVAAAGVALKGDIPILMNEDSVDAWYNRGVFRPELRAGAPPDMFSELGQNWGFPIYAWENLEQDDYEWWRERLRQAAQYYHAYRIDHVLGFFRIWAIPAQNFSGIVGYFWPQVGIPREELRREGFDEGRIRWLMEPHLTGDDLRTRFGDSFDAFVRKAMAQIGHEDLYLFAPDIRGEQDLTRLEAAPPDGLNLTEEQRDWLLEQYRDRALLELPDGTYAPSWTFRTCSRYQTLSREEQDRFEQIVSNYAARSNELWADHGRRLLRFMRETTDMLTCAEDLGVIPEAVPRVLAETEVLSLRIPRWSHYWDRPGEPLIPLDEYPEASVCAPSVHDTSTMRGWWQNESGREQLWKLLGHKPPCPATFDPATARAVFRSLVQCASRIVVFQLQDLLAFTPELIHADPDQERVNVPGTTNTFNWTWRIPVTVETLRTHPVLNGEIRALAETRRQ